MTLRRVSPNALFFFLLSTFNPFPIHSLKRENAYHLPRCMLLHISLKYQEMCGRKDFKFHELLKSSFCTGTFEMLELVDEIGMLCNYDSGSR